MVCVAAYFYVCFVLWHISNVLFVLRRIFIVWFVLQRISNVWFVLRRISNVWFVFGVFLMYGLCCSVFLCMFCVVAYF